MKKHYKHTYLKHDLNIFVDKYTLFFRLFDVINILGLKEKTIMKDFIKLIQPKYMEITALAFCDGNWKNTKHKGKQLYTTGITEKNTTWYIYVPYRIICKTMHIYKRSNDLFRNWCIMTADILCMDIKKIKIYTSLDMLKYDNHCLLNVYRAQQYFIITEDFNNHVELGRVKKGLIAKIFNSSGDIDKGIFEDATAFIVGLLHSNSIAIPYFCDCGCMHVDKSLSE